MIGGTFHQPLPFVTIETVPAAELRQGDLILFPSKIEGSKRNDVAHAYIVQGVVRDGYGRRRFLEVFVQDAWTRIVNHSMPVHETTRIARVAPTPVNAPTNTGQPVAAE